MDITHSGIGLYPPLAQRIEHSPPKPKAINARHVGPFHSGSATEAAKRAGYSEKSADSQGQRLLKNVEVKRIVRGRRLFLDR